MFKNYDTILTLETCGAAVDLQARVIYCFFPLVRGGREALGVPVEPDNEPVVEIHKIEAQTPSEAVWLDITPMISEEAIATIREEILAEETA